MKSHGLDSAESWAIAASSIVINFLILAPARLSGVLFVAFMDRYNANRKEASLPFTICYVLRTLPGPLAGYLGQRFGLREMSLLGCVLSTVGVAVCYFAEDIVTVTIFLGGCYGLGYGFVCSLIPEFLNQYFDKHLAQANGFTMGGAGLGAFLLPPIVEVLISVYGCSGMLLIFGGLVLHSVPATMLLRVANFTKKGAVEDAPSPEKNSFEILNEIPTDTSNSKTVATSIEYDENAKHSQQILNVTKIPDKASEGSTLGVPADVSNQSSEDPVSLPHAANSRKILICSETSLKRNREVKTLSTIVEDQNKIAAKTGPSNHYTVNHAQQTGSTQSSQQTKDTGTPLLLTIRNLRNSLTPSDFNLDLRKYIRKKEEMRTKLVHSSDISLQKQKPKTASHSFRVFLDPAFFLITLTQSSYFFMMFLIWTIIVDFVRDKGIPQNEEVYFVMSLSLSDTLGRLGLGFVTDSGLMTKPNYSAVCFIAMGALSLLLPWTSGFTVTLVVVFLYGFISGGIMIIFPGMVTQFINKDMRTMAMASRTLLNAPMSLMISPLIGFFRGHLGSYDWIFYIVTMVSVFCGIISYLTPKVANFRDKRKEKLKEARDCT